MFIECALAERLELACQRATYIHAECGRYTDVMQAAAIVVEPEQQRSDQRPASVLVPAETGNDAVGRARVLHFEHRALARLVRSVLRLRHHTIESCTLESR